MEKNINPFYELYVTETIGPESFVNLFSPFLINHALSLFQPGNIILKGVKGSGKSMLLRLLSPETRIAYLKAKAPFPVPKRLSNFIGAGINLTRCGVLDFGQRPIALKRESEEEVLPIYFGDFLNYWIILDILKSIETFSSELDGKLAKELGIYSNDKSLDNFAICLASDECWFGYLGGVKKFNQLKERLSLRITTYRSFLNFNIGSIPQEIIESKTSIGVPISKTVKKLRDSSIVSSSVNVFIKIDQYEELTRLAGLRNNGSSYRQIVNKVLGLRDPQVSYRIGTRRYAWRDDLRIYGTSSSLEEERDYKVIDLDQLLRRKENRRTWIFPAFAEDVFIRRIEQQGYLMRGKKLSVLKKAFGSGFLAEELAQKYAGTTAPQRAIILEDDWPKGWRDFLTKLTKKDPLSARLGEAWCRQKGKEKQNIMHDIPRRRPYPWGKKKYWKKERLHQALMQIAGRCGEKMIWKGADDILILSGGNILTFLSICQYIWDVWVRDTRGLEISLEKLPNIDPDIQTVGIDECSSHWYGKILAETGGNRRQRFISYIGTKFYREMYNDKAMSYPGYNGFSIKLSELESAGEIRKFLDDAVDYGDLYDAQHTTKTKDREKRKKWYLNPILSPFFRVPVIHTKEPIYVGIGEVEKWLNEAQVFSNNSSNGKDSVKPTITSLKLKQFALFNFSDARNKD